MIPMKKQAELSRLLSESDFDEEFSEKVLKVNQEVSEDIMKSIGAVYSDLLPFYVHNLTLLVESMKNSDPQVSHISEILSEILDSEIISTMIDPSK